MLGADQEARVDDPPLGGRPLRTAGVAADVGLEGGDRLLVVAPVLLGGALVVEGLAHHPLVLLEHLALLRRRSGALGDRLEGGHRVVEQPQVALDDRDGEGRRRALLVVGELLQEAAVGRDRQLAGIATAPPAARQVVARITDLFAQLLRSLPRGDRRRQVGGQILEGAPGLNGLAGGQLRAAQERARLPEPLRLLEVVQVGLEVDGGRSVVPLLPHADRHAEERAIAQGGGGVEPEHLGVEGVGAVQVQGALGIGRVGGSGGLVREAQVDLRQLPLALGGAQPTHRLLVERLRLLDLPPRAVDLRPEEARFVDPGALGEPPLELHQRRQGVFPTSRLVVGDAGQVEPEVALLTARARQLVEQSQGFVPARVHQGLAHGVGHGCQVLRIALPGVHREAGEEQEDDGREQGYRAHGFMGAEGAGTGRIGQRAKRSGS